MNKKTQEDLYREQKLKNLKDRGFKDEDGCVEAGLCPECFTSLRHEGGCLNCPNPVCGYSRC